MQNVSSSSSPGMEMTQVWGESSGTPPTETNGGSNLVGGFTCVNDPYVEGMGWVSVLSWW